MKKLILISLFIIPKVSFSQVLTDTISKIHHSTIEINYEKGIKELMKKHKHINKLNNGIKGFCVQIYLGDSREKLSKNKIQIHEKIPRSKKYSI